MRNNMSEIDEEQLPASERIEGMYENWFLEYASYVILERAVPAIEDGLKPVQRRILHAMKEMDDGRFNKVANIIGQTMQYHPHGDASIGEAMVGLGQKDLLIETQGNWGDLRTGDNAAAPRYIEARLSKFALEVVFNQQTTDWQLSYDGRKKEPVTFPVKFPLLLAQGVEGIAVGLSTRILPHNFCELIQASIDLLRNKKINLLPDFPAGGMADFSDYNEGQRGGKVRIRATIEEYDKKTLIIKDIPYGATTNSLIDSILKANDKGKIKVKKVVDNTAKDVEILVSLAPGQSPDITKDALYAFTDCEVSISPNTCVIVGDKPRFLGVNELLRINTEQTVELLKRELEIRYQELLEKILFASLEKIFIENRIYRDIEEAETWEDVLKRIDKGLTPFKKDFYREITQDDLVRLTEIKIKRISKFDSFKADELMKKLQDELEQTKYDLENIRDYAIKYFKNLLDKYGKGKERKTLIKNFDIISANIVAANNEKLYVNYKDGFIGYGLKKDEFVTECSDIDDVIVFRADGKCLVTKIADKVFVGKDIIHVDIFRKNDERRVYNMIYEDGKSGRAMVKRFQVLAITRDKEYELTKGNSGSKVHYFSANPNAEAEIVRVYLSGRSKAKVKEFDFDFATLDIKGRGAQGNILTKYPIRKIVKTAEGESTMGGLDIWYHDFIGTLNTDGRGRYLGKFEGEDQLLAIYKDGCYEMKSYELTNKFDPDNIVLLEKYVAKKTVTAVYYDGISKNHLVKRFLIETTSSDRKFCFITDARSSRLLLATTMDQPQAELTYKKEGERQHEKNIVDLDLIVDIKGWKALGNQLTPHKVKDIRLIDETPPTSSEKNNTKKGAGKDENEEDEVSTGDEIVWEMNKENSSNLNKNGKPSKEQLGLFKS
ncbi:DNA gyrase/topoisomerase IV subunit A [Catalinimonas niigatensis]|uniref:DNA gyrase/topoisomerase IV subunit A n=1 Tax=Catalinimonas niigatensis TaxID=1397264 RepID=UPI002666372C|nr:DNA gyrase/topoisomerase IV subunit A [Catalinimonas niigatensis]WPP53706.1 DNA gyrase/topoisomerase IV subunit A [Catalinimonas niigatensis]